MLEKFREVTASFRMGRRDIVRYRGYKAIHAKLVIMSDDMGNNSAEKAGIIEDIENIAVKRAIEKHAWFQEGRGWERPRVTRQTHIRYDLFKKSSDVVRKDWAIWDFLVNSELLLMINTYNDGEETFWKQMEDEIRESCKGEFR